MSYTNETTYYGLPLPTGSDRSTFTDNNTAFQAVDAALHTAYEQSGTATEDIVTIKADIVDLKAADVTMSGDIDAAEIDIEALQQKELLQDAAIDAVKADAQDMITAYNEPTATSTHTYKIGDYFIYNDVLYKAIDDIGVGDTIVPDTNCKTTNVITALATKEKHVVTTATDTYGTAIQKILTDLDYESIERILFGGTYYEVSKVTDTTVILTSTSVFATSTSPLTLKSSIAEMGHSSGGYYWYRLDSDGTSTDRTDQLIGEGLDIVAYYK